MLKPYVGFQTNLHKEAKNKFEKDMAKLYVNALYGKMFENTRFRVNVELVNNRKCFEKLTAKYAGEAWLLSV